MTYAVVRTGGKQYTVREGGVLQVEKLPGEPGESIELSDVLMVSDGDNVMVGSPTIAGARVTAEIVEQGKAKKIQVYKYKSKVRYHKRTGHRQRFTQLAIKQIHTG